MKPISKTQYELRVFAAMMIYVVLVLALLPQARHAEGLAIRVVYSLIPVLPLLYVVWLIGRRIRWSDELEQRTHLIGLGIASAIVGVFSLIGGFLAAADVLPESTAVSLLIWVFPLMMVSYGIAQRQAAQRYGGSFCDETEGMRKDLSFALLAAIFAAIALWFQWRAVDALTLGVFYGFSAAFAIAAMLFALRRRRHAEQEGE